MMRGRVQVMLGKGKYWLEFLYLVVLFLTTRYLLLLNADFTIAPLQFYLQIADPVLLETKLLETVTHLHSQPPLYNLIVGIILKLFGRSETAFMVFHYGSSLLSILFFHRALQIASIGPRLRVLVTTLVLVYPTLLLYETVLHYEVLTICLTALLLLGTVGYAKSGSSLSLGTAMAAMLLLSLTQGCFHPLWIVLTVVLMAGLKGVDRRRLFRFAALPLLFLLIVFVRQYVIFGSFSVGISQLNFNLAQQTVRKLPQTELEALRKEGVISGITMLPGYYYKPLEKYAGYYTPHGKTGIAILDNPRTLESGVVNYQHADFVPISAAFKADSIEVVKRFPLLYFKNVFNRLETLFVPAEQTWIFQVYGAPSKRSLRSKGGMQSINIYPFYMLIHDALYLQSEYRKVSWLYVGLFLILILRLTSIGYGMLKDRTLEVPLEGVLLFHFFWVSLSMYFASHAEAQRYRLRVEPIMMFVAISSLSLWVHQVSGRFGRGDAEGGTEAEPTARPGV